MQNFVFFLVFVLHQVYYLVSAQTQRTLRVPEEATLEDLMCGSQRQLVIDATTVELNQYVRHIIVSGQFCVLQTWQT